MTYKISCSIFPWKFTVILWWVLSQSKLWYQMDGIQTGFNLVVIKPTTGAETCFRFFFQGWLVHGNTRYWYYAFVIESNSLICGLRLFIQEENILWVHMFKFKIFSIVLLYLLPQCMTKQMSSYWSLLSIYHGRMNGKSFNTQTNYLTLI